MKRRVVLRQQWLKQKVHISWHIAFWAPGVLIGIALAPWTDNSFADNAWIIIAASLAVTVCIKRVRYLFLVAILSGVVLGLWRGADRFGALHAYSGLYGQVVVLKGTVTEDTSYGPKGDQRIRVGGVMIRGEQLPGTIWVSTQNKTDIKRGDIVTLSGLLGEGFGNIPASMFRAKVDLVVRPEPGDIGRRVRDWFGAGVAKAMPAQDADFALAYLVGQKLTLSDTLAQQLKVVGLIHAVVASGYHLTVLIEVVRRLLARVSKYLTALFGAGMITGFIMITGFSPSMTRAGLVSGLSLVAWYYGRVIHPMVLLPFAAGLTALYQPEYIWGDVGWYLSFAAFAGVLLLAPLLHHYFWGTAQPSMFREILLATFAAQITTLPITMHVFGYYSIYTLLANLLVVPLVPLTMLLTFISGVFGLFIPPLAPLFGHLVSWILSYMKSVVGLIAGLPGAQTEVDFSIQALVIGYVIVGLLMVFLWRQTKHNFRGNRQAETEL